MGRLPTADLAIVDELARGLTTIHLDRGTDLELTRIREFLELEAFAVFAPVQRLSGWGVDRLEVDNLPLRFGPALAAFLARAPHAFFSAPSLRELAAPFHFDHEVSELIGPNVLAWVGGFSTREISQVQRDRLAALVPAFQRRLAVDRSIANQQRASAALATVLDQLDDATFILGPNGEIDGANAAARELGIAQAIAALTATDGRVERVPLKGTGHTLAIIRRMADTERAEGRVQRAADSWRLTRRQREVLLLVIQGNGNAQIASRLEIGERAVELHVTAILERACVNNRTSLIALVLGAICAG